MNNNSVEMEGKIDVFNNFEVDSIEINNCYFNYTKSVVNNDVEVVELGGCLNNNEILSDEIPQGKGGCLNDNIIIRGKILQNKEVNSFEVSKDSHVNDLEMNNDKEVNRVEIKDNCHGNDCNVNDFKTYGNKEINRIKVKNSYSRDEIDNDFNTDLVDIEGGGGLNNVIPNNKIKTRVKTIFLQHLGPFRIKGQNTFCNT